MIMNIEINNDKYRKRSKAFLVCLENGIRNVLDEEGSISQEKKEGLIQTLVFSTASLLDGIEDSTCDDKAMIPQLGFQVEGEEEVVFNDGNIFLHGMISDEGDE
jgi:hypothetical protein